MKKVLSAALAVIVICSVYVFSFKAVNSKISINYKKLSVKAGTKVLLKLNNSKKQPKWISSDTSVAKVSKKGVVTALKCGKASVTASLGNKKFKCKVSVKMLFIGHRGYSSEFPENTVCAFDAAMENGFDGIECDVWQSKNNELIVCHDPTIERFTGINKYIWNITKKNRKNYPIIFGNETGKKLYFPTLEETVNSVNDFDGYLLVHLKSRKSLGNTFKKKGIKKLIKIIEKNNLTPRTLLFTTGKGIKKLVKDYKGESGAFLDIKTKQEYSKAIKWCKKNKIKTLIVNNCESLKKFGGVKTAIRNAGKHNVSIAVYTATTSAEYKLLKKSGAAYILSNYDLRYEE